MGSRLSIRPVLRQRARHAWRARAVWLACTSGLVCGTTVVRAQAVPDSFSVETLAPGLAAPVAFEFLPDGRVLFAEQFTGRVRMFKLGGGVQLAPVLSVPNVAAGGERGLLGLAVDPAFPTRPYLYVHHDVATPRHIRIARFTLTGDLAGTGSGALAADPASRFDLIDNIPDAADNHNGGTLRFGLDGYLYASIGEDGNACAAQDSVSLRGVILRLRTDQLPDGPGAAFRAQVTPLANPFAASPDSNMRLVAALGLRNPFRFQVDPVSGYLVIGDVGENAREELDLLAPPGFVVNGSAHTDSPGAPLGADFGWPYLEGTFPGAHRNECGKPAPTGLEAPAFEYDRTTQLGGAAIISAGAYRVIPGQSRPWPLVYSGDLFASDYYSGVLRRLELSNDVWGLALPVPGQPDPVGWGTGFKQVADWRLGPDGSLWFCRQGVDFAANTGSLGRILGPPPPVSAPPPAPGVTSLTLARSPAIGSATLQVIAAGAVRLRVLDLSGRTMRTLLDGVELGALPGTAVPVVWDGLTDDGERAPAGMYLALLEVGGQRAGAG